MAKRNSRVLPAITTLLLVMWMGGVTLADGRPSQRRGKVVIIRGAFTVFSLGMNELGEKLRQYGFDVEVVADVSASRAIADLTLQYERDPHLGPIVLIGHSRGAELGPKGARTLQQHRIPVKLVVMVDAIHKTTIPANVQRCVNLYQQSAFSLPRGVPAIAESRQTRLVNADIDKLKSRDRGGSINHFNIDASPWIHDLVVSEVLSACPVTESAASPRLTRQTAPPSRQPATTPSQIGTPSRSLTSTPPAKSNTTQARPRSPSGFRHPSGMAGGLWADKNPGDEQTNTHPSNAANSGLWGERPAPRSGELKLRQGTADEVRTAPRTAMLPGAKKSEKPAAEEDAEETPKPVDNAVESSTKPAETLPDANRAEKKESQPADAATPPRKRSAGAKSSAQDSSEPSASPPEKPAKKSKPIQIQVKG